MKKIYLVISLITASILLKGQPLNNEWFKNVGGSDDEVSGFFMDAKASIDVDEDGNVYMVTGTVSTDEMATGNHGYEDCIIVKYNSEGTKIWTKVFGGSDGDRPRDLITLSTGGFVIVGYTYSDDGDLPNHHGGADGATDGFIARFDKDGVNIWTKQYGGTYFVSQGYDYLHSVKEKEDGNLIAVGVTTSQNGDIPPDWITSNPSFKVGWLLEVEITDGAIITSKRVKSANHNEANENTLEDLTILSDGSGYCTVGYQGYFLNGIHWVTKLDLSGNIVWDVEIGSINGVFVYQASVTETSDGNILLALTNGISNTTNYNGGTDMWVVKLEATNGNVISETNFGGSDYEIPYKLLPDGTGNYYLGGYARSTDGFAHGGDSLQDNFILYLDESFDTLWTYRFGGAQNDVITDLALGKAGEIFIAGNTSSSDGFYFSNYGGKDAWVGKFTNKILEGTNDKINVFSKLYPNPANEILNVVLTNDVEIIDITFSDLAGRQIAIDYRVNKNEIVVYTKGIKEGTYIMKINSDIKIDAKKLIIKH